MGKHFGNLQKISGITYYVLSPYELNPLKGLINPGFFNLIRRFRESFFSVTVPLTIGYTIYSQTMEEYERSLRKNPEDYANEE